jgi:hypothetical protein
LFWIQNGSSTTFKCSPMANHWHARRGMSLRQIAQRVGHHHSTVSRIVNKHRLTNDVKDRPRSGRSRIISRREANALRRLVRRNPFANSTVLKKTVVAPSVAICKNSPNMSEICWLSFKKTCKDMLTNTNTQSFPFTMVPNKSSMEFGLIEESSLVRRKSLLVARDRWQSTRMATTEHCLCWA